MVRALYNTLLLSLLWRTATAATSSHTALPHGYYEELHNSTTSQRLGNVDLLELEDADIAMCHLVNYLGFSRASATDCSDQNQAAKIYKELAATLLAIQHFNNGNGVIVKEIEGIQDRCPIRLSAEFHDSQYTPTVVVQSLTQVLTSNKPCAVVGARTSSSTSPSAIVSGVYDVPQMSFTATSPELNDRFKYPYFSRLVPADDAAAKAAVRFLSHTVQSTHLAVLYVNDPFGNNYNQAIQRQADRFNITLQSFPLAFPPNEDDIQAQVARLKETGIRHVYMVFFSSHIGPVMTQAAQLDIVGPEYFWFLGISTSYFGNAQLEPDSPLIPALTGMGVLPEFGAKPDTSGYHRFVDVWKQLDETDVDYFNSKMPPIRGHELCFQAEPTFFQDVDSGSTAHFAYDTVMALGLGACAAAAANKEENSNGAFAGFDGTQHTQAIIDTVFEGATGIVSLEQETGSRDPLRFQYAVLNVQPKVDPETNLVTFETPETVILTPNEALTDWEMIPKQPFHYADGSTTPPASLPDVAVEMNYLGDLVTFGYVTCAIIVGCSLAFAAWTFCHRQVRVVRASQPFFLVMVCSGVLVMGLVLIPLSVDDEHFGKQGTDAACMSIPWLSSMGFVMAFSALASKTWRINKLHQNAMRFTRLKLTPWDVLKPFLILTTANVIVLLAWTIVAPLQFVRMPDSGTDQWNRVVSSTGRCVHNQHDSGDSIPFMIALAVVNLSAVVFANAQAYVARNIHTEYSESRYIALIMCLLLQSWLTGIPVIGLVYDIPRASYVVVVLIVLLTSMAILLLIFVPKIMYTRAFLNGEITGAKNRLSTKLNDDDGNPDEWEDDDNDKSDDGLKVKVFRDSACVNVGSDSLRQSYASVEGLKLYLRQSNSKRIDNSLTGSISNSHAEMSGSLRHSAKNVHPMENLSSGSMQQSSEKSLKHAAPPMARLSEESTKDLESSRSMHTRSEELPPEPHDIEEALSRIAHTMRRNSRP